MSKVIPPYRLEYPQESLHRKVYCGDVCAVERWLTAGGNPDVRTTNGQTLLHAAVHGGHVEIVRLLLRHGADVNACSDEAPHHTYPVQIAAYYGMLEILDILTCHGADLTVVSTSRHTLIHLAVYNNEVATMQYLLEREADIEVPSENGVTPLCSATMHGFFEATELLLRAGANPNAAGLNGRTPLFYAGSLEVLEVLLAHGARLDAIDIEGNTLLHQAAAEMVHIDFDVETDRIVRQALPEGMKIAQLFIERGMDINYRNHEGRTPLAIAIEGEDEEMATFLRLHGGTC